MTKLLQLNKIKTQRITTFTKLSKKKFNYPTRFIWSQLFKSARPQRFWKNSFRALTLLTRAPYLTTVTNPKKLFFFHFKRKSTFTKLETISYPPYTVPQVSDLNANALPFVQFFNQYLPSKTFPTFFDWTTYTGADFLPSLKLIFVSNSQRVSYHPERSLNASPLSSVSRLALQSAQVMDFVKLGSFVLADLTNVLNKRLWTMPGYDSQPKTSFQGWRRRFLFSNQLKLRAKLKRLNLTKKNLTKVYYTHYSHYVKTNSEVRSYARVMLPTFQQSSRGSFWRDSFSAESNTISSQNTDYQRRTGLILKTFKTVNNSFQPPVPLKGQSRAKLLLTSKKLVKNIRTQKSRKKKSVVVFFRPRRLSYPKRRFIKPFRRFKRRLFRVLRRLPGFLGYLKRRRNRYNRRFRSIQFRFSRLLFRRRRRVLSLWGKRISRLVHLRPLKRRITRPFSRRFILPKDLAKRAHSRTLTNYPKLTSVVKASRRLCQILGRPTYGSFQNHFNLSTNSFSTSILSQSKPMTILPNVNQSGAPLQLTPVPYSSPSFFFPRITHSNDLTPLKYLLASELRSYSQQYYLIKNVISKVQHQLYVYSKTQSLKPLTRSNLWSLNHTGYSIRRKFLRLVASSSFAVDLSFWYYKTLLQFIENCSGRKVALYFGPFIENSLTFEDKARCTLWNNRVTGFQRIMGHRIFVYEALSIVAISIRLKDPTFLSNWIRGMLKRLSFWRYRLIFRYLKFLLRYIFKPNFHLFGFRGVKLSLKGKISVAGNARTRTLFLRVGDTSHSKMDNKVAYDLSLVNTFTGVLGFKLFFYY